MEGFSEIFNIAKKVPFLVHLVSAYSNLHITWSDCFDELSIAAPLSVPKRDLDATRQDIALEMSRQNNFNNVENRITFAPLSSLSYHRQCCWMPLPSLSVSLLFSMS